MRGGCEAPKATCPGGDGGGGGRKHLVGKDRVGPAVHDAQELREWKSVTYFPIRTELMKWKIALHPK